MHLYILYRKVLPFFTRKYVYRKIHFNFNSVKNKNSRNTKILSVFFSHMVDFMKLRFKYLLKVFQHIYRLILFYRECRLMNKKIYYFISKNENDLKIFKTPPLTKKIITALLWPP